MSVPKTYLMTTPSGDKNPFGRAMSSSDIIRKLQKINPDIWVDEVSAVHFGMVSLWSGSIPGNKELSRKITALMKGIIPEFTQQMPDGKIFTLGWRRIFEKVMVIGGVPRYAMENAFGITLDVGGADDYCISCRKRGEAVKADSRGKQCSMHRRVLNAGEKGRQQKDDLHYMRRKYSCQQLPSEAVSILTDTFRTTRSYGSSGSTTSGTPSGGDSESPPTASGSPSGAGQSPGRSLATSMSESTSTRSTSGTRPGGSLSEKEAPSSSA